MGCWYIYRYFLTHVLTTPPVLLGCTLLLVHFSSQLSGPSLLKMNILLFPSFVLDITGVEVWGSRVYLHSGWPAIPYIPGTEGFPEHRISVLKPGWSTQHDVRSKLQKKGSMNSKTLKADGISARSFQVLILSLAMQLFSGGPCFWMSVQKRVKSLLLIALNFLFWCST